jgi:hypothetical protein
VLAVLANLFVCCVMQLYNEIQQGLINDDDDAIEVLLQLWQREREDVRMHASLHSISRRSALATPGRRRPPTMSVSPHVNNSFVRSR